MIYPCDRCEDGFTFRILTSWQPGHWLLPGHQCIEEIVCPTCHGTGYIEPRYAKRVHWRLYDAEPFPPC